MSLRDAATAKEDAARLRSQGDEEGARRAEARGAVALAGAIIPGTGGLAAPVEGAATRLGVFAGGLAKSANGPLWRRAVQMETRGVSPEEIFNQTGWFRGVDKKWKFRINDQGASIKNLNGATTLGQAIDHPDLFAAYPKLAEIKFSTSEPKGGGSHLPGRISIGPTGNNKKDLGLILHEVQHAIQEDIEGFAKGANALNPTPEARQWASDLIQSKYGHMPYEKSNQIWEKYWAEKDPSKKYEYLKQWNDANKIAATEEARIGLNAKPHKLAYERSAGEVEANQVQNEFHMGGSTSFPPSEMNVPYSEQFIQFAKGNAPSQVFVPVGEGAKADMAREMWRNLPKNFSRPDKANRAVFENTGSLFTPEGQLVSEIPDVGMGVKRRLPSEGTLPLGDIISHPELFGERPDLAGIPVNVRNIAADQAREGKRYSAYARTTDAGIELPSNMKAGRILEQMPKILQYKISEGMGGTPAFRHSLTESEQRIADTIAAVAKAREAGAIPDRVGETYVEKLRKTLGRIEQAHTAGRFQSEMSPWLAEGGLEGPQDAARVRKAISLALNNRNAGNWLAQTAQARFRAGGGPEYPFFGTSMGELTALPPADVAKDPRSLADWLARWRTYGQGSPQGPQLK